MKLLNQHDWNRWNVKRIESTIFGQNFTCTNSSTIWASNSSCSSKALGQKLQRNLEAGHIFMTFGGSSEAKHTHLDQVVFLNLPPELLPVFSFEKNSWESYLGYTALASPAFPTWELLGTWDFSKVSSQIKTPGVFWLNLWMSADVISCDASPSAKVRLMEKLQPQELNIQNQQRTLIDVSLQWSKGSHEKSVRQKLGTKNYFEGWRS